MTSLYDVFFAICGDEGDHVGTMQACLDPNIVVASPSMERKGLIGLAQAVLAVSAAGSGLVDPVITASLDAISGVQEVAAVGAASDLVTSNAAFLLEAVQRILANFL